MPTSLGVNFGGAFWAWGGPETLDKTRPQNLWKKIAIKIRHENLPAIFPKFQDQLERDELGP